MNYAKDDLKSSDLPFLLVNEEQLYRDYPRIGFGDEASVFKYNNTIALKYFNFFEYKSKLPKKFEKIELLGKLQDSAACFPLGLFGFPNMQKEGYYCELVNTLENYKNFNELQFLKDTRLLLNLIIEADEAIQRFHKMGLVLGDIKEDNILIDCNKKVKFVDTDNWMYNDYGFDVIPYRANSLSSTFNKEFSLTDNDRFVFAMMAIQYFSDETIVSLYKSDNYFKKLVEYMDVTQEVKDGLRLIFSDAKEKPYIGPLLSKINPEQKILTKDAIYRLNQIV